VRGRGTGSVPGLPRRWLRAGPIPLPAGVPARVSLRFRARYLILRRVINKSSPLLQASPPASSAGGGFVSVQTRSFTVSWWRVFTRLHHHLPDAQLQPGTVPLARTDGRGGQRHRDNRGGSSRSCGLLPAINAGNQGDAGGGRRRWTRTRPAPVKLIFPGFEAGALPSPSVQMWCSNPPAHGWRGTAKEAQSGSMDS